MTKCTYDREASQSCMAYHAISASLTAADPGKTFLWGNSVGTLARIDDYAPTRIAERSPPLRLWLHTAAARGAQQVDMTLGWTLRY